MWTSAGFAEAFEVVASISDVHQVRVEAIMRELLLEPRKTFATNLMFVESRAAHELHRNDLLERCLKVHRQMLSIVRPSYIVCLGNNERLSAFSLLRQYLAIDSSGHRQNGGHKCFRASFPLSDGDHIETTVVGVRHPSRWNSSQGLRHFLQL